TRFSRDWSSDVCSSDLVLYFWFPNLKQMKRYTLILSFLAYIWSAQAQIQVTGKIQTEFLVPLSNATVYIEPFREGTKADQNGEFRLHVPEKGEYMLRIQYLGKEVYGKPVRI